MMSPENPKKFKIAETHSNAKVTFGVDRRNRKRGTAGRGSGQTQVVTSNPLRQTSLTIYDMSGQFATFYDNPPSHLYSIDIKRHKTS